MNVPTTSHFPKCPAHGLPHAIIRELLRLYDCYLVQVPGGGRGLYLNADHVLLWSSEQVYKLVQCEWVAVSPETIPLEDYLRVLRDSVAKRIELLEKRIAKMDDSITELQILDQVAAQNDHESLLKLLNV